MTQAKFINYVKAKLAKKDLSEQTEKLYLSTLTNLRECMGTTATTLSFVNKKEKVLKCLADNSIGHKRNTLSAINGLITNKKLIEFYKKEINDINSKIFEQAGKNEFSETQKKTIGETRFGDLGKIPAMIESDFQETKNFNQKYNKYQMFILASLLLREEFLPRLDYHSVKIIKKRKDLRDSENQLLIQPKKMTMFLNKFKNVKKFGAVEFQVNKRVAQDIRRWLEFKTPFDTEYLFFNKSKGGKPYDNKRFSELVKRMFRIYTGKALRMNDIRTLREIDIQQNPNYLKLSDEQKDKLHRQLFHSKAVAQRFYNKI